MKERLRQEIREYLCFIKNIKAKIAKKLNKWVKKVCNLMGVGFVDFYAELGAKVVKKDGTEKDLGMVARKKVTQGYVNFLVDCMQASDSKFADFKYHLSGTGTNAESNTDTQLQTAIGTAREVGSQEEGVSDNIYKSVATIAYSASHAVTEHGIFNEQYVSAQTDGVLLDRSVFSPINVEDGDSIQWTYLLTANPEA